MKPGEQSFHGGKVFCTKPCFNELFLDHCTNSTATGRAADQRADQRADQKAETANQTEATGQTEAANKKESTNKTETVKQTGTTNKTETVKQTGTTNKTETESKPETLTADNNDKIDQQTKAENNKCSWAARADHHTPCLHCVKCDHLIVNHRRLSDEYPHPKFSGYRENVEIYRVTNARRTSDPTTTNTRNLNANSTMNNLNLNRSVQASDFIGRRCVRCSRSVFAAELSPSINFPYHQSCLRCSICDRALQPAAHAVHDGLPICHFPCYNRIYNSYPYRKGWQECRP